MKRHVLYLIVVLCASCSVNKQVAGSYLKKGKDFKYTLELNKDSTFVLTKLYFEANSHCKGRWHYISNKTILLKCDTDKSIASALSSGYMADKEQTITIINGNKLKLENQVLNRTN